MWPFTKKLEKRSSMSGFTAELMTARESYVSGRRGIAELSATVQSCVSLWENGFSLADVQGFDLLTRHDLAMIGRSMALRGEAVFLMRDDGLIPCADWDLSTKDGKPTAYRVSVSDVGGGRNQVALAGEVLHFKTGVDVAAPYAGTAPLKRSQLTAGLLNAVETVLADVFSDAPFGSSIVPMPESDETKLDKMARGFRGKRGRIILRESVNVSAAGGAAPNSDWKPQDLSPDLQKSMPIQTLNDARASINFAFGLLPSMTSQATTGPLIREAQRHLAQWTLQPLAMLISEEISEKIGQEVMIDTLRPLQAYDVGGRSRSLNAIVQAMIAAKEGGISGADMQKALTMVNFGEGDHAA